MGLSYANIGEIVDRAESAVNAQLNPDIKKRNIERNKIYAKKYPERKLESNRKYNNNNRDLINLKGKIRHSNNRERDNARTRAWQFANREIYKEYQLSYSKNNKEKCNARCRKHKALKRGSLICDLTNKQWFAIVESYNGHCCYCGRTDLPLTQDHIHSLNRGGNHTASNVAPACQPCNSSKGAKMLDEWIKVGGYPLHPPYKQINKEGTINEPIIC